MRLLRCRSQRFVLQLDHSTSNSSRDSIHSSQTCPNCRSTMSHSFLEGRTGYTPLVRKSGMLRAPPFSPTHSLPSQIPSLVVTSPNLIIPSRSTNNARTTEVNGTQANDPNSNSTPPSSRHQARPSLTWADLQISTFIPYFDNDVASSPNPTTPSGGLPPRFPTGHTTSSKKSQIIRNALENVDQWLS